MILIFLVGFFFCEAVATVLGFQWFGTTAEYWPGWVAFGLVFLAASMIWPIVEAHRRPRQ